MTCCRGRSPASRGARDPRARGDALPDGIAYAALAARARRMAREALRAGDRRCRRRPHRLPFDGDQDGGTGVQEQAHGGHTRCGDVASRPNLPVRITLARDTELRHYSIIDITFIAFRYCEVASLHESMAVLFVRRALGRYGQYKMVFLRGAKNLARGNCGERETRPFGVRNTHASKGARLNPA